MATGCVCPGAPLTVSVQVPAAFGVTSKLVVDPACGATVAIPEQPLPNENGPENQLSDAVTVWT